MTGEDLKEPLNSIGNINVKVETILSSLNKHINESDIVYIDYSIGSSKNPSINQLNELFCDNVIVFTPTEKRNLFKLNDNNEREIDYIHIPRKQPGKTAANLKVAFNHLSLSINKQQVQPTRIY